MVYKRKDLSDAKNQLWTLEPSDPPREPDSDDSSDEEDVGDRISAFFGNFSGWGRHKNEALDERALERAAEKVEKKKKKKSKMRYIYFKVFGIIVIFFGDRLCKSKSTVK